MKKFSVTFQEVLGLPEMREAQILSGSELNRIEITGAHVIEISESADWMKSGDLVFTSGVAFQDQEKELRELIQGTHDSHSAGLVIEQGKYIQTIPDEIIAFAKELDIVLIAISFDVIVSEVISKIYYLMYHGNSVSLTMEELMRHFLEDDDYEDPVDLDVFHFDPSGRHAGITAGTTDCIGGFLDEKEQEELMIAIKRALPEQGNLLYLREKTGVVFLMEIGDTENVHMLIEGLRFRIEREMNRDGRERTVNLGVGNVFSGSKYISESLRESRQAFHMVNVCRVNGGIRYYNELGIYRIFFELPDQRTLKQIYLDTLGKLIRYDHQNGTELVLTLRIYLEENENITDTSERMFAHRNTIKYRIHRINEILGYDIQDHNAIFRLRLAFKIINYLS